MSESAELAGLALETRIGGAACPFHASIRKGVRRCVATVFPLKSTVEQWIDCVSEIHY